MFILSSEYGSIPYDGIRVYSLRRPRHEFVERAKEYGDVIKRPDIVWGNEPGWQNFISLPVNGAAGALAVGWGPTMPGRNMPRAMVYCNPSTAGLNPKETLALFRWVHMWPEGEPVAELATKVDLTGVQAEIDAQLYLPGARTENKQYPGETHNHGSRKGNHFKIYDKGRQTNGAPNKVTRVEMTEHFKNNANPKQNLRRPTLEEWLRGDLVDRNGLRRVKVVDLAAVGDDDLTKLAREKGLTEAIRLGLPERPDRYGHMRYPCMQTIRRRVNAHATDDVMFNLYRTSALAWHSQFDLADVGNLVVTWSDELGLEIIQQVNAVIATKGGTI